MRKLRVGGTNLFNNKYEVQKKTQWLVNKLPSEIKGRIESHFNMTIKDVVTEWVTFKWAYAETSDIMIEGFTREVKSLMKKSR